MAKRLGSDFMLKASELLRQGKTEELWQMCCGYLNLNISEFMDIQERLLLEQLELLNGSPIGKKILKGAEPKTVKEFRDMVPLTTYADYCPELEQKREDVLPVKPDSWVRTSGRSGEYKCRWVPLTPAFAHELGILMYGIGLISSCKSWGDCSQAPQRPKLVYTVAPRPYMSGAMTCILEQQTPVYHMPKLEEAEGLSFEDRVRLGFKQALSHGIDYFFGMALALVSVGEKFTQSSGNINIRPLLSQPGALFRIAKGLVKSKLAKRPMLPKDLWPVKGIIITGLESWIYKDKIQGFWGRYPLDVYAGTEGGIYATQTWDYDAMTFIPNLNFLEFIPEEEQLKWQMDRSYRPKTLLLNEVKAGENYELVITNYHGGPLTRYRIGDMVKITSLRNEKLGIELPQMLFERRADGLLNFVVIQLTERQIWQAIEKTGIAYEDWVAYKELGKSILHLLVEPKDGLQFNQAEIAGAIQRYILEANNDNKGITGVLEDLTDMYDFTVEIELLPKGTFARYTARKQAEGADLAHLKPPHINPSDEVLSILKGDTEEIIVVKETKSEVMTENEADKVTT